MTCHEGSAPSNAPSEPTPKARTTAPDIVTSTTRALLAPQAPFATRPVPAPHIPARCHLFQGVVEAKEAEIANLKREQEESRNQRSAAQDEILRLVRENNQALQEVKETLQVIGPELRAQSRMLQHVLQGENDIFNHVW